MKKLKQLLAWIVFEFNSILNTINWNKAILKCHFKKWCSRNPYEIFFILPFTKTTLGVISQNQRKDYNKHAMKQGFKKLSHNELIKNSYYCTGKIITLN